jgi:hypothetical protein
VPHEVPPRADRHARLQGEHYDSATIARPPARRWLPSSCRRSIGRRGGRATRAP